MSLREQVERDMTLAMKARDEARLSTLRLVKAALHKRQVDQMKPLDASAELAVLTSLVKQRREAAELFRKGQRPDLAHKEEQELALIESYLPAAPTEAELEAAIDAAVAETGATSARQMGAVMKAVQARLAGRRVDGKALSDRVRTRLG